MAEPLRRPAGLRGVRGHHPRGCHRRGMARALDHPARNRAVHHHARHLHWRRGRRRSDRANTHPDQFADLLEVASKTVFGVPIAFIIFVVIALLAWFFLERTYAGRQVYAVGGNREAARLAGIPTSRRIVLAYVVSGSCARVVGIIFASQLTSGTADSTTGYELIAIASAVIGGVSLIGGQGRIIGVVAGAALLVVLEQGLVAINVDAYYQSMVVALVLLVAVVVDRLRVRRLERIGARIGSREAPTPSARERIGTQEGSMSPRRTRSTSSRSGSSPAARPCTGTRSFRQVAENSAQLVAALDDSTHSRFASSQQPVVTEPDGIRRQILAANSSDRCVGVIAWMHTFSPAQDVDRADCRAPEATAPPAYAVQPRAALERDRHGLHEPSPVGPRRPRVRYLLTRMRVRRKTVVGHVAIRPSASASGSGRALRAAGTRLSRCGSRASATTCVTSQ